jgi:hypothetical protein
MTGVKSLWRTDRSRLIALAGAGAALGAILLNTGFFFRPGVDDVLGGLAHHAFVLGFLLLLTAGSRTVSLSTLGIFWLIGVWSVFGLTYLVQDQLVSTLGVDIDGELMLVWLAPLTEETLKLAPVAIFLLLAGRGMRHPSLSDGLLLGFMVGAGEGWGAAAPWTMVFPTISPLGNYFALNHALWTALSGLTIGVAVMLRHLRWAWPIALVGLLLSFTNHLMANQYTSSEFGTSFLLDRVSGGGVPWFYQVIRDLSVGGRLPMLLLVAGAVAIVVAESLILRWLSKRDRLFPPLSIGHVIRLIGRGTTKAGAAQLLAAERYVRLRRSVHFAAWRAQRAGADFGVSGADYTRLVSLGTGLASLAARLGILPVPEPFQPTAAPPADAVTDDPAAAATAPESRAAGVICPPNEAPLA